MLISNGPPTAAALAMVGAVLPLQIGVPEPIRQALQQKGSPIPPPRTVQALIDTGASVTGVTDAVFQGLGLMPIRTVPISGVSGANPHGVYVADLQIMFGGQGLSFPGRQLVGMNLSPPYEALLGRDLLQMMQFTYCGGSGLWTLAF